MRLDGKPLRGRLHPIGLPEANNFARKFRLLLRWSDMFDYTITEHQVERMVVELGDATTVTLQEVNYMMTQTGVLKAHRHTRGNTTRQV
jgi:hypothetical protein